MKNRLLQMCFAAVLMISLFSANTIGVTAQNASSNIVRLSEVFPSEVDIMPSNGVFAGIARNFAKDTSHGSIPPIGLDVSRTLSYQEQQISDALLRQFIEAFDMESGTGFLGINAEGFAVKLNDISVLTYVAQPGEQAGGWDLHTNTIWIATHDLQNGTAMPKRTEQIAGALMYELFGRSSGLGTQLSNLMVETLKNSGPSSHSFDLLKCTVIYHQIGAENVLLMAKQLDENQFRNWMDMQLREINPNIFVSYAQIQIFQANAGIALHDSILWAQLADALDIPTYNLVGRLEGVSINFVNAANSDLAAVQFSEFVEKVSSLSLSSDLVWAMWIADGQGRSRSILDEVVPMIDLNNAHLGVRARITFPIFP